ncbi:hypothetical protein AB0L66_10555 [Streptomyces sp. NPDC052207]|uniref:hypothetical protein n=1 Tax=Streptomyces sp. NPDC052207 TaxID=3155418 RepID=UPI00343FB936
MSTADTKVAQLCDLVSAAIALAALGVSCYGCSQANEAKASAERNTAERVSFFVDEPSNMVVVENLSGTAISHVYLTNLQGDTLSLRSIDSCMSKRVEPAKFSIYGGTLEVRTTDFNELHFEDAAGTKWRKTDYSPVTIDKTSIGAESVNFTNRFKKTSHLLPRCGGSGG